MFTRPGIWNLPFFEMVHGRLGRYLTGEAEELGDPSNLVGSFPVALNHQLDHRMFIGCSMIQWMFHDLK